MTEDEMARLRNIIYLALFGETGEALRFRLGLAETASERALYKQMSPLAIEALEEVARSLEFYEDAGLDYGGWRVVVSINSKDVSKRWNRKASKAGVDLLTGGERRYKR